MKHNLEVVAAANRCVDVRHEDGHRWFFSFPDGYVGGRVPTYRSTEWANGETPEDPFITDSAATVAIGEAKRQRWI